MKFNHAICVLLAPAVVHAAAFPWAVPEPTGVMAAVDNWSPAPTPAPLLSGYGLFKRQVGNMGNTCGFLSGSRDLPITCNNPSHICVTNTLHGVGGCCDPNSRLYYSIPTTCIGSADMTKSCVDASCSSDGFITKCTEVASPSCYRIIIQYSTTSMTQHGCVASGFTSTAMREYSSAGASLPRSTGTTSNTPSTSSSSEPVPTSLPNPPNPSKTPIGAIVGGTIGGCVIISLIVIAAIFLYRRRKRLARNSATQPPAAVFHGVTEYDPSGFSPSGFSPTKYPDTKTVPYSGYPGPVHRTSNAMPPYPGMDSSMHGIVEVDGAQRPVEAPAENIYYAQEYIRR